MRGIPEKQVTPALARTQLVSLLYSCRPAMLATYTAESLCRMYRVDARTAEYELTIARQKRAGEVV